jgi:hypothetical protein
MSSDITAEAEVISPIPANIADIIVTNILSFTNSFSGISTNTVIIKANAGNKININMTL